MGCYVLIHTWSDSNEGCEVAGQEMSINMEETETRDTGTRTDLLKSMGLHAC